MSRGALGEILVTVPVSELALRPLDKPSVPISDGGHHHAHILMIHLVGA